MPLPMSCTPFSPPEFIAARDARAKEVRSSGDEALYRQIKELRRPSVAAWLVNVLARSDEGFEEFSDLSRRLRDAQTHLDAPTMKELGQERTRVVAELVERAVALAKDADPEYRDTATVRDQVTSTLTAAVADPTAEAAVTSGRLVSPLSYAGFGEVDLTDAVATPLHVVREQEKKPTVRSRRRIAQRSTNAPWPGRATTSSGPRKRSRRPRRRSTRPAPTATRRGSTSSGPSSPSTSSRSPARY